MSPVCTLRGTTWAYPLAMSAVIFTGGGVMGLVSAPLARLPEADLLEVLQYERPQGAPVQVGLSPLPGGAALSLSGSF